jgi:hypothetical protein
VFATMRRKRRTTKMKSELGQSVDHFKRAAAIAAQETSSSVVPTITAARDRVQPAVSTARGAASSGWGSAVATITPLVAAATDSVRRTGKDTAKSGRKSAKSAKSAKANKKNAKKVQKSANKVRGRKQGRNKSTLFGLALVGAAVGVGAAWFVRKRQAAQWDEYDPSPATTEPVGADDAAFEPAPTSTSGLVAAEDPTVVTGRNEP